MEDMSSSRNRRIWKELLAIFAQLSALIAFSFILYLLPRDVRGVLLGVWILAAWPLFIAGLAMQPIFAVAVTVISFHFALTYCSDMGGPYVHDFAAAWIGLEAVVFTIVLSIVFLVKVFSSSDTRKRTRLVSTSLEPWPTPIDPERLNDNER